MSGDNIEEDMVYEAQNNQMIDSGYLEAGALLMEGAAEIERLRGRIEELELDKKELQESGDQADALWRVGLKEREKQGKRIEELEETHDWQCGCGHWNGPNLPHCGMCGRRPGGE